MNERSIKSDLTRIDRTPNAEIDYLDIPPLDKAFSKRETMDWPPAKKQPTVRLDTDVPDEH